MFEFITREILRTCLKFKSIKNQIRLADDLSEVVSTFLEFFSRPYLKTEADRNIRYMMLFCPL